jgi:AraC family transcriptional regulator
MLNNRSFKESLGLAPGAHFGEVGSLHTMGPLIVACSDYRPFFETPSHWHETASFTIVSDGGYVEDFGRKIFECTTGSTLYRPAGETHRDRIGKLGARCLMIEMSNEWVRRIAGRGLTLSSPRVKDIDGRFDLRIRRELAVSDELSPIVVESLVVEMACEMERPSFRVRRCPLWLRQLRDRIEAEFAHLPALEILARDAGVHPGHMARAFRQQFSCTIGECARARKIEFCCARLRSENWSLCDLAARAGFSSQAHLTRSFKRHTGVTPGEFRRAMPKRALGIKM